MSRERTSQNPVSPTLVKPRTRPAQTAQETPKDGVPLREIMRKVKPSGQEGLEALDRSKGHRRKPTPCSIALSEGRAKAARRPRRMLSAAAWPVRGGARSPSARGPLHLDLEAPRRHRRRRTHPPDAPAGRRMFARRAKAGSPGGPRPCPGAEARPGRMEGGVRPRPGRVGPTLAPRP